MPALRRRAALALIAVAVAVCTVVVASPAAAAPTRTAAPDGDPVVYTAPVTAPIDDPFRAPLGPYGPGHRGIEYDTPPGTTVAAAAPGTVVFAGTVSGSQWVTLLHADGIRTTYGPLRDVAVSAGALVADGAPLGTTSGRLLLTARVGENYVDPAQLISVAGHVHLVPEPSTLPSFAPSSFSLTDVLSPDAIASTLSWTSDHVAEEAEAVYGVTPAPYVIDSITALRTWHDQQGHCTAASATPSPMSGDHVAILVGGLGSSSDQAAVDQVDTAALGYPSGDVVRFSYNGGRVSSSEPLSDGLAGLETTTYGPHDTAGDLDADGHRLATLLADAAEADPTATLDVYAHSLGGLVLNLALDDLAAEHPEVLPRLGVAATLATPHQGAELARALDVVTRAPLADGAVNAAAAAAGSELRADDPVFAQLVPGSDLLRRLSSEPLPAGPRYISIAARGDAVVPSPDAEWPGATNTIVPIAGLDAHTDVLGATATTRELSLALAGLPPSCRSATDAVLDAIGGDLIAKGERFLADSRGP
jgi:hypothetical protein